MSWRETAGEIASSFLSAPVIVALITMVGGITVAVINRGSKKDKQVQKLISELQDTKRLLEQSNRLNAELRNHIGKVKTVTKIIYNQYEKEFAGDPSKLGMLRDLKEAIDFDDPNV